MFAREEATNNKYIYIYKKKNHEWNPWRERVRMSKRERNMRKRLKNI